jgi:outer membrane lipopolysaccharide assembly protein LptE/RlpB
MSVDEQLEQNNLKIVEELDKTLNISLLEIEDDKSVEETIKILEENPLVEYAEPNYIRYFHDE